jgi:uncharacterized membrane protein YhdT
VNTSDQVMNVKATIEGGPWSGNKEVQVAAGATVMYSLAFKPSTIGRNQEVLMGTPAIPKILNRFCSYHALLIIIMCFLSLHLLYCNYCTAPTVLRN